MSPDLVVFAIRSLVRFGRTLEGAAEQKIRDRDLIFPMARQVDFDLNAWLRDLISIPDIAGRIADGLGAPLLTVWDADLLLPRVEPPDCAERLIAAALSASQAAVAAADPMDGRDGVRETAAFMIVSQWAAGAGPPSPYTRVILDLADIAFEYLAVDPRLLGVGGNGEKLIKALAASFAEVIPPAGDIDKLGPRRRFGERLVGAMFRGGLQALAAHPDLVFGEAHLQALVTNSLPAVVKALPEDLNAQVRWAEVGAALAGPAAAAALSTIAENQQAFLGAGLGPATALGAVTQALLVETSKAGLRESLTDEGLVRLFRGVARVAAERPELFVGRDGKPTGALTRDLFGSVAGVLAAAEAPLSKDVAVGIAVAAVDAVERNLGAVIRFDPNWDRTAVRLAGQIVGALQRELKVPGQGHLAGLFSGAQLVAFGRIVLEELAANPAMAGLGADERGADRIVSAVARAMALDKNLLLGADDWLKIVAVAAGEAARNPGRLFDLSQDDPKEQLATQLIGHLLAAGAAGFKDGKPAAGTLLFSRTLRELIEIALAFGANHAAAAIENSEAIGELALRIEALSRQSPLAVGADDVVELFGKALPRLLAGGQVVAGDPAALDAVVALVRQGKLEEAAARLTP